MNWAVNDLEDLIATYDGRLRYAMDDLASIGLQKAECETLIVQYQARLRDYRAALALLGPRAEVAPGDPA